jgi:hypothetical protein
MTGQYHGRVDLLYLKATHFVHETQICPQAQFQNN